MTKNITQPENSIRFICPCCGKPVYLEMQESRFGEIRFRFFHYTPETSYAEIQANGLEFGIKEGGEEDGQC